MAQFFRTRTPVFQFSHHEYKMSQKDVYSGDRHTME